MVLEKLLRNQSVQLKILTGITLCLSICLQAQWNFFIQNVLIRIALSDLVLPFILMYVGWLHYNGKIAYNKGFREFIIWGVVTFGIMVLGAIITYQDSGIFSHWALKKILGWIVLMAYFVVGYVISQYQQNEHFIKYFMIAYGVVGLFLVLELFWVSITSSTFSLGLYSDEMCRTCGFVENPNAFGILGVVILGLCLVYRQYKQPLLSMRLYSFLSIITLLTIFFSSSRGAWVAGLGGIALLLYRRQLSLKVVKEIFIVIFYILVASKITNYYANTLQQDLVGNSILCGEAMLHLNEKQWHEDRGLPFRLKSTAKSLHYWMDSPFLGIGLGNFLVKQKQAGEVEIKTGEPGVIHNTLLWILTEMGLLGFLVFAYLPCRYFYKTWQEVKSKASPFMLGMLFVMTVLGISSMATEIFYQRYLWVFWGMLVGVGFRSTQGHRK
jgi:hypothetical protein